MWALEHGSVGAWQNFGPFLGDESGSFQCVPLCRRQESFHSVQGARITSLAELPVRRQPLFYANRRKTPRTVRPSKVSITTRCKHTLTATRCVEKSEHLSLFTRVKTQMINQFVCLIAHISSATNCSRKRNSTHAGRRVMQKNHIWTFGGDGRRGLRRGAHCNSVRLWRFGEGVFVGQHCNWRSFVRWRAIWFR